MSATLIPTRCAACQPHNLFVGVIRQVGEAMPEPPVKMKLKKLLLKDKRFRLTPTLEVELI